jgi:hypothetical protein
VAYGGWEPIGEPLGEGGQGKVYKARSPARRNGLANAVQAALRLQRELSAVVDQGDRPIKLTEFARLLFEIAQPDSPEHLGALEVFNVQLFQGLFRG